MKQLVSCLCLLLSFACFNSNESVSKNANTVPIPEAIHYTELSAEELKDRAEIVYKAGIYG